MIEIKHRRTGEVLKVVEAETLRGADLRGAKGIFIFIKEYLSLIWELN